jgi:hypothetical protein
MHLCLLMHNAGLGRAPATALAYMYWLRGWQLPDALAALTSVRACSPRIEAIRAATADLLTDSQAVDYTIGVRRRGTARKVQVRWQRWLQCAGRGGFNAHSSSMLCGCTC